MSGEVNVIFSCLNFFSFWFLSFVCAFVSVLQQHSKRLFLLSSARFPSWLSNPILALFFFFFPLQCFILQPVSSGLDS